MDVKGRLFIADGTSVAPSLAFNSEQTLGLYKSGAGSGTWVGGTFNAPVGLTGGPATVSSLVSTGSGTFGTNPLTAGPTTVSSLVSTGTGSSFGTNPVTITTITPSGVAPVQVVSSQGASAAADWPFQVVAGTTSVATTSLYGMGVSRSGAGPSIYIGTNKNTTTGEVPASSSYISNYSASNGLTIGRGLAGIPNFADIKIGTTGAVSMTNGAVSAGTFGMTSTSMTMPAGFAGPYILSSTNGSGFNGDGTFQVNVPSLSAGALYGMGVHATGRGDIMMGVNSSSGATGEVPASWSYITNAGPGTGITIGRGTNGSGGNFRPNTADISIATTGAVAMTNGQVSYPSVALSITSGTTSQTRAVFLSTTNAQTLTTSITSTCSIWSTTATTTRGSAITNNGTTFTVPTAGTYSIEVGLAFDSNATGTRSVWINSSTSTPTVRGKNISTPGNPVLWPMTCYTEITLAASGTFTVGCAQDSGLSLNIGSAYGDTYIRITKIY